MKKYELYDVHKTSELICTSNSIEEIEEAADKRINETNGECELFVKKGLYVYPIA